MALKKSGVRLVAENESGFLGAMGKAQKAVQGFEGTAAKTATGGLSAMNIATAAVAGVIGGVLVTAVSRAISGLFDLGKSAFGVVASYERLSVSLQTLLAREIKVGGAADDMATAFDLAAPAARDLLNWIEELAIISPFDQEGVAAAYQTLQVYGFLSLGAKDVADAQAKGIVSAQRLTEALINQASVSTKGAETMGLVSYALGQIRTAGRLLMQDLRQLTNAGVDVNSILGEMGYSLADVGKEAISSDEFLLKFVETIERDLGGAAARQAGTLAGLANSLADLGKKYLREFFGPIDQSTGKLGGILGAVQPLLQKFVDTLMDDRVLQGVQTLGLLIGEGLTGSIGALGNILSNVVKTIQRPFTQAATSAFSWGQNIIVSLATGIINAAGSVLVAAINFVGQILANWFAPGSPPAVAPQLTAWGEGALAAWLHGFTTGDYDVLKGIQQPLQNALQTLVAAGELEAGEMADIYAGITSGLAEALAAGTDPSEVFDKIAREAGEFGPELAELARRQFDLAQGVAAVEQAERDLADARKREEEAGLAVNRLTQEYNDLLRSGADDATLQAKLEEINAAEDAKELAGEQADAAETQLDTAKANLDVLEEQVRLQRELVDQLIELARMQILPPEAPAAGGGGEPGGVPSIPPLELPDPGEAVQSFLDAIIQRIRDAAAAMFQPITDAWNAMVARIREAWDNFIASLQASGLLAQLQSIWDNAVALAQIGLSILWEWITTGLQTIANIWNTHKETVLGIWNSFWGLVASVAGGFLGLIVSNIAQRLEEARTFFDEKRQQITEIIQLWWSTAEIIVNTFLGSILTYIQERLNFLQGVWYTHGVATLAIIDQLWDKISEVTFSVLGVILDFIQATLELIRGFWEQHGAAVTTIVNFFLGIVGTVFDTTVNTIATLLQGWFALVNSFWQTHGDTVVGIVETALGLVLTIFEGILALIGLAVEGAAALITGDWTSFLDSLQSIWETAWNNISSLVSSIVDGILTLLQTFISNVTSAFTAPDWSSIGGSIISGVASGITSAAGALQGAIESAIKKAIDAAKRALGISSPSKVFAGFGANISLGLAEGIGREGGAPIDALSKTIGAMIQPPLVGAPVSNTYANTLNLNMNNNVNGQIDLATLDARIVQVIKRQFGGGRA